MKRIIMTLGCAVAMGACSLLGGCGSGQEADPLKDYGSDALLPIVNARPTPSAPPATPPPCAETTEPCWAELPLSDAPCIKPRPTRRIDFRAYMASDSRTAERRASEQSNSGGLQANVSSDAMACDFSVGEENYIYFTAQDGQLYRLAKPEKGAVSLNASGAQRVSPDSASGFIVSPQGDLIYIASGRRLVSLKGGNADERRIICEMEGMSHLTRWDERLFFMADSGGGRGVYSLEGRSEPALIIDGVLDMQLDALSQRILALTDKGLRAYSFEGKLIMPVIDCSIKAFCLFGAELYYAAPEAIYCVHTDGSVDMVAAAAADWLGFTGARLIYRDTAGLLHRAWPDGSEDEVISRRRAYNPAILDSGIAFCHTSYGGVADYLPFG